MSVLALMESFAHLPSGWKNGKGNPISADVIRVGKALCSEIFERGYTDEAIEVFPFADGCLEVVLEAVGGTSFLIRNADQIRIRSYQDNRYILRTERTSLEDAIRAIPPKKCHTFDFYISATLTKQSGGSEAEASNPTKTESLLSNLIVYENAPQIPVGTEKVFTPLLPAIQSFTLFSQTKSWQAPEIYSMLLKSTNLPMTVTGSLPEQTQKPRKPSWRNSPTLISDVSRFATRREKVSLSMSNTW